MTKHIGLIILDGWGLGDGTISDAIAQAHTPFMDELLLKYPNATLKTFGENVGLPDGQMGNSEVGHLNIGAGRIVYQELTRINKSIRERDFFSNKVLLEAMAEVKKRNSKLHLIGLVSKGGVHSSQEHLYALCELAKTQQVENVYIHGFTDGRDCDPNSAEHFFQELEEQLTLSTGKIASVCGRYFAMDRDNRWERIKKTYDLLVNGKGARFNTASEGIIASYISNISDEFIEPFIVDPKGTICDNDVVINFNFRTDRPREITIALSQRAIPEFEMQPLDLYYCSMTNYDSSFKNIHVAFEKDNLKNTLGEVISNMDLSQIRIAETEKYPHVSYFFSGGREEKFPLEERIMVNSPKVATYDLQPEMSAVELSDKIIHYMQDKQPNFICLNFANPDMVGHTGVYDAIVKAVEKVDQCLKSVVEIGLGLGYEFLVIADHGNADFALNEDGSPNTAHSLNPVPIILVTKEKELKLSDGILADVAPTILDRLRLAAPIEMTGSTLVINNQ